MIKWPIVAILVAAVVFLGYKGVERYNARQREQEKRQASGTRVLRVRAVKIEKGDVPEIATLTGSVLPMAEVQVSAKISGRLDRLRLEDGTLVDKGLVVAKPGTLIATLDHAQWQADVEQAKAAATTARAAVGVAKASVEQAVAVRKDAEREYQRIHGLHEKQSISDQALDQAAGALDRAQAAERVARAGVTQSEAAVAQAEAALACAQVRLDEAFIRAPIAGVVSHKFLDEGNMVAPGSPIVTLTDLDNVKVIANANERDAARLSANETRVALRIDSDGSVPLSCSLCRVGVVSDPVTHTVEVEIRLPNPGHRLRPGSFARVDLTLGERKGVPLVPDGAVLRRLGETYVFVFEDGKVHRRTVRLGKSQSLAIPVTPVLEGLAAGELVIVSQQQNLGEGDAVELDTAPADPKAAQP